MQAAFKIELDFFGRRTILCAGGFPKETNGRLRLEPCPASLKVSFQQDQPKCQ
jgi:hypothetical protein